MKNTLRRLGLGFVLVAGVSLTMAQDGNINFATFNNNPAKGKVSLPAIVGGGGAYGPAYVGQLIGGTVNKINSLSPIGTPQAFSSAVPGYISATPSLVTATGSAPGDTYFYALRAWDAASGSYDNARITSPFWGTSGIVSVVLGGTDAFGGFFTTPTANGFASFTIFIPEPTTFTLAGLGMAALLVIRRRK